MKYNEGARSPSPHWILNSPNVASTLGISRPQCATAYTDENTGITYILIVNEGLWFGERMKHSLINPNQCRKFGIDLCDDPYDPHRSLRLLDNDTGITIPFVTKGSTVLFCTHAPSQTELDTCLHVVLTNDAPWDPQNLELMPPSRSLEEEEQNRIVSQ